MLALSQLPDHAARELQTQCEVFAGDKRYALRINYEFTVDVMPSIAGRSWEEMRRYIQTIDFDGDELQLLNLEGLLLTKQGLRPKDQMDAAMIKDALAEMARRRR